MKDKNKDLSNGLNSSNESPLKSPASEDFDEQRSNKKPVNFFFDNGMKVEYEKPIIEKLPKIVSDVAKVVIKDNFEQLDMMIDDMPEEML